MILPSEGHRLMQFVYVKDLVELAMQSNGANEMWLGMLSTPRIREPITQHELVLELARAAGVKEAADSYRFREN